MSTLAWTMFAPRVWGFAQGRNERVGRTMWGIAVGCVLSIVLLVLFVGLGAKGGGYDAQKWAWIDVVYGVSYLKLFITVVKYIPQVYTNWLCGSTVGWSIGQNMLDLVGAVLSVAQLFIDSFVLEDGGGGGGGGGGWSGVLGNPVKFALGNVTVVFDVIFVLQHYVWFRGARGEEGGGKELDGGEDGERRRLLDNGSEGDGR